MQNIADLITHSYHSIDSLISSIYLICKMLLHILLEYQCNFNSNQICRVCNANCMQNCMQEEHAAHNEFTLAGQHLAFGCISFKRSHTVEFVC